MMLEQLRSHNAIAGGRVDDVIKHHLIKNGFDPTDIDTIKRDFHFIHREGDEFKHLHHIPTGKRIVSITDKPEFKWQPDWDDFDSNKITCTIEYRYY